MTTEMGKTLVAARAEAAKCVKAMRWYADRAEGLLADEYPSPADVEDSGGVAAPGPLPPARRGARRHAVELPALAGGPVRRARPDGRQRRPAQARLQRAADRAATWATSSAGPGFPEGCFQTLLVGSGAVEGVLRDPRVAAATLTGSEPAGRSVAAIAGDEVKKTVLELGGSDPFVVMPSADLDRGRADRGHRPRAEQRAVLHRRQALHRAHRRLRRVRRRASPS